MIVRREVDLSELFWENTKLNAVTIQAFARRQEEHALPEAWAGIDYPGADVVLPAPGGSLFRLLRRRRSHRLFSPRALALRDLGALFGAFGGNGTGARMFPSAGATYPLEVFALLNRVEGDLSGTAVRYNHENHSLSVIGPSPPWAECAPLINLETQGDPAALFLFVLLTDRITSKYGDRGTRFALIEVGHAAQNLALVLAEIGLAGCEAGGVLDEPIKLVLGLSGIRYQVALGYACGYPGR